MGEEWTVRKQKPETGREPQARQSSSYRDQSFGTTSPAAPANTFRPSANVTFPPDALFEPSLARKPSTLITSPTFRTSLLMPRRASMPGGPPEKPQVVTLPLSSLTST